jgi:transcriptional regulator with XRE-family HTH domain
MTDGQVAGGRDELARRLRVLRKAAGLSGAEVAASLGAVQSKISRLENGRVLPDPEFVEQLARACGATPHEVRELRAIAEATREGSRRVVVPLDVAGAQQRIGRAMRDSALIRSFSPSAVPGELQTETYARLIMADGGNPHTVQLDSSVRQRMINQKMLDAEYAPRRFVLLVPEIALGVAVGSAADMVEQVEKIRSAVGWRNVRVGVIPWGADTRGMFPLHSWHLFDERHVVVGFTHAPLDLTRPQDVAPYVTRTDELEAFAVWDDDARAILTGVADRYRGMR